MCSMEDQQEILSAIKALQSEQQSQREMLEGLQKGMKGAGGITRRRLIVYGVFTVIMGGAVYFYYSTMVGMLGG